MDEGDKKTKMIESHTKIGKSFKNDVQTMEKELDDIELQLIVSIVSA